MGEDCLKDAVELISKRLYWLPSYRAQDDPKTHFFSTDNTLVYENFFADFGPLNLAMVCRYCKLLEAKLGDPGLADKRIVHYCAHDPKKLANAAFLICSYLVIVLHQPAEQVFKLFSGVCPPILPFRDATCGPCSFQLTILDCLKGLEFSIEKEWFDWRRFDVESYEFFEKVENGDMNWIIPGEFLAFASPNALSTDADGLPAVTPENYVPIFHDAGIELVVRLNKKQYDRRRFIANGIKHVDLFFLDGSCPSREIISKFLHIMERETGPVAVHCKAGLGRTGTLIGLYAMKHHRFPARAFIGWNRIVRPGSILGAQQQFLCDMQPEMFSAGCARRCSVPTNLMDKGSVLERKQAEMAEDKGQGERLCGAKRLIQETAGSPVETTARRKLGWMFAKEGG